MSDKPSNPAPGKEPRRNDPLSALAANDIDKLLADAESLASVVAHEVGTTPERPGDAGSSEEPTHAVPDAPATPSGPAATGDVISQIEFLLAGNVDKPQPAAPAPAEVVADTAPATTEEASPAKQSPTPGPAAGEADGFFGGTHELTAEEARPPVAAERIIVDTGADAAVSALATVSEAVDQAVVQAEIDAAMNKPPKSGPAAAADSAAAPKDAEGEAVRLTQRLRRKVVHALKAVPRHAPYAPLYAIAGVLRLIDLPFAGMSDSLKNKLGYVGMVTAIMAAVAWAMVLLGN